VEMPQCPLSPVQEHSHTLLDQRVEATVFFPAIQHTHVHPYTVLHPLHHVTPLYTTYTVLYPLDRATPLHCATPPTLCYTPVEGFQRPPDPGLHGHEALLRLGQVTDVVDSALVVVPQGPHQLPTSARETQAILNNTS